MMILNNGQELWKGLSDLPAAALAAVFGFILLRRRGHSRNWAGLFFLISASALLGALLHAIQIPEPAISFLWSALYLLLFALIRNASFQITCCITGFEEKERPAVWTLGGLLFLAAVFLRFFHPGSDIYCLVLFAVFCFARVVFCLRRSPGTPKRALALLLVLLAALLFQALKTIIPFGVVLSHLMITAALFLLFLLGIENQKAEAV